MEEERSGTQETEDLFIGYWNKVFGDTQLREVLVPIDQAHDTLLKAKVALRTIGEEHSAGRLADGQVPRLKATLRQDAEKTAAKAAQASRAALEQLTQQVHRELFATPARGGETAEGKQDIALVVGGADDAGTAVQNKMADAIRENDGLVVRLLASPWGRDLLSSKMPADTAGAVHSQLQATALSAPPELFPQKQRAQLARRALLPELRKGVDVGGILLDQETQDIFREA